MSLILQQPGFFDIQTGVGESQPGELLFQIEIPGRLPSWNEILGMQHWSRVRFKTDLQLEFLSALRASASDSLTKTTSAKSTTLIAADMLGSYMETIRQKRRLKSLKKRLEKVKGSSQESKSSDGKVPF